MSTTPSNNRESRRLNPTATAVLFVGTLLLALLSAPAASRAEVLVLHDGQVIETQGPWTLAGRRITYTALNGTFSAIRTSLVDLDKSRALEEARRNPVVAPPKQAKPREAGLVVRQSDVRTVARSTPATDEDGPVPAADAIAVTQWSEEVETLGTKLVGTLRNGTKNAYIALDLEVSLMGENGDRLATRSAQLQQRRANPEATVSFEVLFPDVYAYKDVVFEIKGDPYEWREIKPDTDDDEFIGDPVDTTTDADEPPPRV